MILFYSVLIILFFHTTIALIYRNKKELTSIDFKEDIEKKIDIIIPCYNEGVVIEESIKSFKNVDYENSNCIFVNDGSNDNTLEILKEQLDVYEIPFINVGIPTKAIKNVYRSKKYNNYYLIDKHNGGKADSLNVGINFSNAEFCVTLDADSILRKDSIKIINHRLQDEQILGVGGNVQIAQGFDKYHDSKIEIKFLSNNNLLENVQVIEYIRGLMIARNAYAKLEALAIISGAFGCFNRRALLDVNGLRTTLGEDIDITLRLQNYAHKRGKKLVYEDRAICFTEAPNNWKDLKNQRIRWQKAFIDAIKYNYKFLFKGASGLRLSLILLGEALMINSISSIFALILYFDIVIYLISSEPLPLIIVYGYILGLIMQTYQTIAMYIVLKDSCISTSEIPVGKTLILLTYEFFIYKMFHLFIFFMGSVLYFINPHGWNKVQRIGKL